MRAPILAALAALLVSACATPPPSTMQAQPGRHAFTGFATLSSIGSFEYDVAPTWTRLAQARHNAARALNTHRISVDVAKRIQARADLARALLDEAAAVDKLGYRSMAREKLRWAIAAVDDAEILLKGTP